MERPRFAVIGAGMAGLLCGTEAAKKTVWTTGCRSWYLDDRGIPATWPWPFDRFRAEMAAPRLEAYERVG